MAKLFLDTNVLLLALRKDPDASNLVLRRAEGETKIVSMNVLKEVYRVLSKIGYSNQGIQDALEFVRDNCVITPPVSARAANIYDIRDRNDVLILAGALREKCDFLVTEDFKLRQDAEKYLKTLSVKKALGLLKQK